MNKMLIFPLALMFLISVLIFMQTAVAPLGSSPDQSGSGDKIYINGSVTEDVNVTIPKAGTNTINIWGAEGLMAYMLIAIGIGIVAGIHVLGSGITTKSQEMIFIAVFFIGLWIALTIISATLMYDNLFTSIIWIGITLVYFVGLGTELTGGGGDD